MVKLYSRNLLLAATSLVVLALPGVAMAADRASTPAPAASDKADDADQGTSANQKGQANDAQSLTTADVIVTGSRTAAEAPISASLKTTQPQSAVTRQYIDNSLNPAVDFNQIAALTPGVTISGTGNGIGASETKLQIRGFQDGEYNVTYDSVPFADTNNPTHHSTSFFPSNTIETLVVDRGPGNASQLGQASYGGNVNIYSRAVSDKFGLELEASAGYYNTYVLRSEFQSGKIAALHDTQFVLTTNFTKSDGVLTLSPIQNQNLFFKAVIPVNNSNRITILTTYNQNYYYQSDAGNGTCGINTGTSFTGQITGENCSPTSTLGIYGKNYGLGNNNSLATFTQFGTASTQLNYAQNYWLYNRTDKKTDFSILRWQSDILPGLTLDNRFYVYGYTNHTNSGQDASGRTANTVVTGFRTTTVAVNPTTNPNGQLITAITATGIPGYDKLNKYRVLGYIGQINYDFSFGRLRVGGWFEHSATDRYLINYDLLTGQPNFREAFNNGSGTAAALLLPSSNLANVRYSQHSGWNQFQVFSEFEIRPFAGLAITPGIKYLNFTRSIVAPVNQTSRSPINTQATWTRTLPFATVNYAITQNWSAYFQYAQGFYVPDLSSFYSPTNNATQIATQATTLGNLQPQSTTNYQLGTVWHGPHFSVDFDIYRIDVANKIATSTNAGDLPNTLVNIGQVRYRGVEGEVSYSPMPGLTLFINGTLNEAFNLTTNAQIARAAKSTAGGGVFYNVKGFNISFTQKYTGPQYANEYNGLPGARLYRISPYSVGDFAINKTIGAFRIGVTVSNVFNNRAITQISTSATGAPTTTINGVTYQSGYGSFDQLQFLPPRAFLLDVRVRL